MQHEVDVAIVGAGLAGLAAARRVAESGRTYVVLEARDRVGGRVLSEPIVKGQLVDLGAQWIGPDQHEIRQLAHEFRIPISAASPGLGSADGRGSAVEQSGVWRELADAIDVLEAMASSVPRHAPWTAPGAAELDGISLGAWMRVHLRSPRAQSIFNTVIEGFIAEPKRVSLLHTLFYGRSNGGIASFFGLGPRHDDEYFEGGAQQVPVRLADEAGANLRLSTPVRSIQWGVDGVSIRGDHTQVTARKAIVAMAPMLAGTLDYDPQLPEQRRRLTSAVPLKAIMKAQVAYASPFWRDRPVQLPFPPPILAVLDGSPADGSIGVLTVFLTGVNSAATAALSDRERHMLIVDRVASVLGPQATQTIGYLDRYWAHDEYSLGDVSFFPPGIWTQYGPALREPVGPIHWAGTETATEFAGQMEGAIRSGYRAAHAVLGSMDVSS